MELDTEGVVAFDNGGEFTAIFRHSDSLGGNGRAVGMRVVDKRSWFHVA